MSFLSNILAVALTATAALAAGPVPPNSTLSETKATCLKEYPGTFAAIKRFCDQPVLTVPSKYATKGMVVGDVKLWIEENHNSSCSPPVTVAFPGCYEIFHEMCAMNMSQLLEGPNDCMVFHSIVGLGAYNH